MGSMRTLVVVSVGGPVLCLVPKEHRFSARDRRVHGYSHGLFVNHHEHGSSHLVRFFSGDICDRFGVGFIAMLMSKVDLVQLVDFGRIGLCLLFGSASLLVYDAPGSDAGSLARFLDTSST
jgi:hypothetical protein